MSNSSGENRSSQGQAEVGPAPYYHRSDCNICRKQDGLKTGSELLDVPRPGGYIVEGEHFLAEHAPLQESSAQDPRAVRALLPAAAGKFSESPSSVQRRKQAWSANHPAV